MASTHTYVGNYVRDVNKPSGVKWVRGLGEVAMEYNSGSLTGCIEPPLRVGDVEFDSVCRRYNAGLCVRHDCRNTHACAVCGDGHPAAVCRIRHVDPRDDVDAALGRVHALHHQGRDREAALEYDELRADFRARGLGE